MSYNISFGTFNVGQGYADYRTMLTNRPETAEQLKRAGEEATKEAAASFPQEKAEKILEIAIDNLMRKIETSTAERLSKECDVIALQEVSDFKRPFIQTLEKAGFNIYYSRSDDPKSKVSTAIALRRDRFDAQVENRSIQSKSGEQGDLYGQNIAAVVAKIKGSDVEVAFSSLHSWGFTLFNPEEGQAKVYGKRDLRQIEWGMRYTKEALDNLADKPFAVMGGDMNNNPQNYADQFNLIKNRGFQVLEPNEDTNISSFDPNYPARKIDFMWAPKLSLLQRICSAVASIFRSTTTLVSSPAHVLPGFDHTVEGNCSDHKPVVTILTITRTPSIISRIYHYFLSCLS